MLPFVAGSSGLRLRQPLPCSAVSGLVWTAFITIGYAFSESFTDAGETATRVTLVAVLLIAATYFATARLRRPRRRPSAPAAAPGGALVAARTRREK